MNKARVISNSGSGKQHLMLNIVPENFSFRLQLSPLLCLLLSLCFLPGLECNASAQATAPAVIVYSAKQDEWTDALEALGTLRARETVSLTASVTDTITSIHFEDGQRVEKGFVLVEMTDGEESALVNEMSARAAEAKRQFDRVRNLPKGGAVSESLFDQREREYKAALAQLEATKSRLKDRLIIAPFSGVLGLRNISVGALVVPGQEITTLTDDSTMKLDFAVPSLYLSSLELGLPVVAHSQAFPTKVFEGTISGIDSRIDPITRSIVIRALIPNSEQLLKPGLLMTVTVKSRPRKSLTLAEEALLPDAAENSVLVVAPDTLLVEKRKVQIGARKSGFVEILQGVNEGELVITHGTLSARPGSAVTIQATQQDGQSLKELLAQRK